MIIETTHSLMKALRSSGLLRADELGALASELAPLHGDLPTAIDWVVKTERLSFYQLRKVLHGKSAELTVGDYLIIDRLGGGGMGRVYRACDTRTGREVALKIIRQGLLANPVVRGRYEREVEAAGALRHPNIVAVEDAGEADGRHYLAMEFVDGIDLSVLVRDHFPLEVPEACEYARQAALGLGHAHRAGIVHRDIKPSNIVVSGERHVPQATEQAVVKILDMGLIRVIWEDEPEPGEEYWGKRGPSLTRDGAVVGTPDYMAPEQTRDSRAVDHRADLYSLGCTLYYLLTGRPPFAEGGALEKLSRHRDDAPPPLQALRPDVPTAVAAVVARMMAKDPADRHPSAAAVAADLAPLTAYPARSGAVPVHFRRGPRPAGPETPVASGGSTYPVAPPSSGG